MEKKNNVASIILLMIIVILLLSISILLYQKHNTKIENTDNESIVNNIVEKEVIKTVEKGVFVKFDPKKVTNLGSNMFATSMPKVDAYTHVSVSISDTGEVEVSLTSNDDDIFSNLKAQVGKEYNVKGLSGKVVDSFIGVEGQAISPPIILFLMEDGTVEYVDSKNIFENLNFNSSGRIDNLTNIVRFEQVGLSDGAGGYVGIVAIKNDGTSYVLSVNELLNK